MSSSDHRCCTIGIRKHLKAPGGRNARYSANKERNKCGKWRVNLTQAEEFSAGLAEQLELLDCPLSMEHIARLSDKACYRPRSYRYQGS